MSELSEQIQTTADAINNNKDRIVIEDGSGARFIVSSAFAVGTRTEDPGVVVRIVRTR